MHDCENFMFQRRKVEIKRIMAFFQQGKMSFNFVFIFVCVIGCVFFCFAWLAVYALSLPVNKALGNFKLPQA